MENELRWRGGAEVRAVRALETSTDLADVEHVEGRCVENVHLKMFFREKKTLF